MKHGTLQLTFELTICLLKFNEFHCDNLKSLHGDQRGVDELMRQSKVAYLIFSHMATLMAIMYSWLRGTAVWSPQTIAPPKEKPVHYSKLFVFTSRCKKGFPFLNWSSFSFILWNFLSWTCMFYGTISYALFVNILGLIGNLFHFILIWMRHAFLIGSYCCKFNFKLLQSWL